MTRPQLVLFATFPLSGTVTTLLGPLLPVLLTKWTLSDAEGGQLFLTQFLASTVGALASARLSALWTAPRVLGACYALMAASLGALAFATHLAGILLIAGYGFALGVSIPLTNLLAARAAPGRESATLNLLNLAWCSGAVLAPPLVGQLLVSRDMKAVLFGLSVLALLASVANLFGPAGTLVERRGSAGARGVLRAAAWTGLFLFLYVGVENGLSGWLPTLAQRTTGAGVEDAAIAQSVFWGSLLLARVGAALWIREEWTVRVIVAGTLTAMLGTGVLMAATAIGMFWAGASLAGLGLAPLFPSVVALFEKRAAQEAARWTGSVFATGGCGGAILPLSIGVVSTATGSLTAGIAVAFGAGAVMLAAVKPLRNATA